MKKKGREAAVKKNMMIVEDFDYIRNLLGRPFQLEGYEVISAGNMHEAIAIAEHETPDKVFIDFDLSNDPYVLMKLLHALLPACEIIVVDGRRRQCNTEEAKSLGANKVIDREFNPVVADEIIHGHSTMAFH